MNKHYPFAKVLAPMMRSEREFADPAIGLDAALMSANPEYLQRLIDTLTFALSNEPGAAEYFEAVERDCDYNDVIDAPDRDVRLYLRSVVLRAREVLERPDVLPQRGYRWRDGMEQPRRSTFTDPDLELRATQILLDRHDGHTAPAHDGMWTRTMHGDLGDELGVTGLVHVSSKDTSRHLRVRPGELVSTTGATLTAFYRANGTVSLFCRPELVLDETVHHSYPYLRDFVGATYHPQPKFNQRTAEVIDMMECLGDPAFTAVRDELDRLLSLDDEEQIRRVVEHLGSYVLPVHVRYWLSRVRWRFDAFDWLSRTPDHP